MLRSTLIYTTVFTAFIILSSPSLSPVLAVPSPNTADRQPPSRNLDIDFLERINRDGTDDRYRPRYSEKIYQLAQQRADQNQDTTDTSFLDDTEEEEELDEQEDVNIFDAQNSNNRTRRPVKLQTEEGEESFEQLEKEKWQKPSDNEEESSDSLRRTGPGKARLSSNTEIAEAEADEYLGPDEDDYEDSELLDDLEGKVPIRRSALGSSK